MVKYQQRYWIESNAEWTTVQDHDSPKKTSMNHTKSQIATRFEVYPKNVRECGSPRPIRKTKYDDIYILYKYGFDMDTGKEITKQKDKFEKKIIKIKPKSIISDHTRYEDEENKHFYYGFVNENTHMNMKMDLYMSNMYTQNKSTSNRILLKNQRTNTQSQKVNFNTITEKHTAFRI